MGPWLRLPDCGRPYEYVGGCTEGEYGSALLNLSATEPDVGGKRHSLDMRGWGRVGRYVHVSQWDVSVVTEKRNTTRMKC